MRFSLFLAAAFTIAAGSARAESVIRYGISLADIPLTSGQPDRGAGAYQFTGYTIYDPLVAWEMNVADRPGKLVPGLATSWVVDETDKTRWRFTLRPGREVPRRLRLRCGCGDLEPRQGAQGRRAAFDKRQSAQVRPRLPSVKSWAKLTR